MTTADFFKKQETQNHCRKMHGAPICVRGIAALKPSSFFAVSRITKIAQKNNASIFLSSLLEEKNVLVGSEIGAKHFSYACMIRSGSCWQHKMCKILPRSTRNSLCAHLMLAVQDLTDVGIDPLLFCLRKQLAALVSDLAISVTVSHRKMADVTFFYYTDQSPHTASVNVTVGRRDLQ